MPNSTRQKHQPLAEVLALELPDVTMVVADALQRDFGLQRHAIKRIARATNSNERNAENWIRGRHAPDAVNLLRLMSMSPTLAGEVRRLTAMSLNHDPRFERAFNDAVRLFMQTRGG